MNVRPRKEGMHLVLRQRRVAGEPRPAARQVPQRLVSRRRHVRRRNQIRPEEPRQQRRVQPVGLGPCRGDRRKRSVKCTRLGMRGGHGGCIGAGREGSGRRGGALAGGGGRRGGWAGGVKIVLPPGALYVCLR